MALLETLFARARVRQGTVVLPEGGAPQVRDAAERLAREGLAQVLLIGGTAPGCETIDPAAYPDRARLTAALRAQRPKLSDGAAQRLLARPVPFGGALVAAGLADAMVAGAETPTKRVIEAAAMTVGLAEGVATPSSYFLMALPGRPLIFADCAFNLAPTPPQLADIAIASARTAEALLGAARVAFLSFSTLGSGSGGRVDAVRAALAEARRRAPEIAFDGEFQADAALNAAIAARKGAGGAVAGQANVLIFPDLDAGNIGYKLVQELAGVQAIGPILQGFARPVADLSRGATADDVVAVTAITLSQGPPAPGG